MPERVNFRPTKKLFIDVLTRDVSVHDCIFDLFDNAVDSYTRHGITGKREIKLKYGANSFEVLDTCGGIAKEQLKEEVFRFGATDFSSRTPTIGVYGIGLKRSVFKLGRLITFETDDGSDFSKLVIDVDDWETKTDEEWDLDLSETSSSRLPAGGMGYTRIGITKLTDEAKETLTTDFENNLKQTVSIYYSLFIQDGNIDFHINGERQSGFEVRITTNDDFKPVRVEEEFEGVTVTIICWLDLKEEKRSAKERGRQGWNVYMNRRLVISDDTSGNTGWVGVKPFLPKHHSIYNQFRGIVFLNANNPSKLPINTSKNGFNRETKLYHHLILRMSEVARPLINYLSDKYDKEKVQIEQGEDQLADHVAQDIGEQGSKNVTELSIREADTVFAAEFNLPELQPAPKPTKRPSTIQYQVQKWRVDLVKEILGLRSNSDVGAETFEYFWDSEELDGA